jgi:hypothetical protein
MRIPGGTLALESVLSLAFTAAPPAKVSLRELQLELGCGKVLPLLSSN